MEAVETRYNGVESVNTAIDAFLTAAPAPGETVFAFIVRCAQVIAGDAERALFVRALVEALIDAGHQPTHCAKAAQEFLRALTA